MSGRQGLGTARWSELPTMLCVEIPQRQEDQVTRAVHGLSQRPSAIGCIYIYSTSVHLYAQRLEQCLRADGMYGLGQWKSFGKHALDALRMRCSSEAR